MRKIKLTQGKYTIVDDNDFERLNQWKWCYNSWGYAKMGQNYKTILMHRLIMKTPEGMETDHINGDRLDNRRSNLRICTNAQNHWNRKKQKNNTSKYTGIRWHKEGKKWEATVQFNKKKIYLGLFKNKTEAAKNYNQKARELFGEYIRLK